MKKTLLALGGGLAAAGSITLFAAGTAGSQPSASSLNVVGEPYMKALSILKSQGVKGVFGGSFGGSLPQSQCLVDSQKIASGKMILMLDCSQAAAQAPQDSAGPGGVPVGGVPGGPTVGSNGVTTVTPTPVVPIQGAPGAGAPPPGAPAPPP